jgi:FixJ family two-component response regulator
MMQQRKYIAVVDDDESIRESLPDLLRVFGHEAEAFSSAEEFLSSKRIDQTKCMVLDIAMPGRSGVELQRGNCSRCWRVLSSQATAKDPATRWRMAVQAD